MQSTGARESTALTPKANLNNAQAGLYFFYRTILGYTLHGILGNPVGGGVNIMEAYPLYSLRTAFDYNYT